MKAVVQRVKQSSVTVDEKVIGEIGAGLMVLLGVSVDDERKDADFLASKIVNLRIFEDAAGKMNQMSHFTLMGDCRKVRRPSFIKAALPEKAVPLYEYFTRQVKAAGVPTATGQFGAMMDVALINDGPVTIILDSRE